MSTAEVIRIFEIIRHQAKVPSVSFTGGEPLQRTDIVRLTAEAVKIGLRVNLITNGTMLADSTLAEELKKSGLNSAQVSLEGPNAEIHDKLTNTPGSFEKTVKGIAALQQAGVHVHTNTTVNALNVDHLEGLVEFAANELNLPRLSMNLIIPAGTAMSLGGGDSCHCFLSNSLLALEHAPSVATSVAIRSQRTIRKILPLAIVPPWTA
jgi:MoaA/NifB/PqqE/SkfB family radical SAM enzyme